MSKSLGNLVFVRDLLKDWEGAAVRLALLSHHYREDWEWRESDITEAGARLDRWRSAARGDGEAGLTEVRNCLDNDLDAPDARWRCSMNRLRAGARSRLERTSWEYRF